MPYSAISHTSERNKLSEKNCFPNLRLIPSHKKQIKQNAVKHQYDNKVRFLQFSAYKTNQEISVNCLVMLS